MAHEFESGFFAGNTPAWHELGTVVSDAGVTGERALVLAGLDWEVQKEQLQHRGVDVPGKFVTFREHAVAHTNVPGIGHVETPGTIDPFGVVGAGYQPFQNTELFEFGDAIVSAAGGAHYDTAGSLRSGANVWALIAVAQTQLATDEEIAQYIAILNSHDGTGALHAIVTNVRIVCQNTWSWALEGAPRKISVRHTGDLKAKVAEAQRVLGVAQQRTEMEIVEAQALLTQPFGAPDFKRMIEVLVPMDEDASDRSISLARSKREQLWTGYKLSDNIDNVRHTKYGALQSIVETNDHVLTRGANAERRLTKVFDGTDLVNSAHEYLLEV